MTMKATWVLLFGGLAACGSSQSSTGATSAGTGSTDGGAAGASTAASGTPAPGGGMTEASTDGGSSAPDATAATAADAGDDAAPPTGAPGAVANLVIVNQGGPNNDQSPLGNTQALSWIAPTAGKNPIDHYQIYRNGQAYATTTTTAFTDTDAPNSNFPDWKAQATVYAYQVAAVDAQGVVGAQASQVSVYGYRDGVSSWHNDDLSFGTIQENYSSTNGSPQGGTYDLDLDFINGGFQPVAASPGAPQWDLEIGAFTNFVVDLNPGTSDLGAANAMIVGTVSRLPTGDDVYGWHPGVNLFMYGKAPQANTWQTYKIPLTDLGMGSCTFTGTIDGTTLTVTAIDSGGDLVDAGGFISGPNVPVGTYIQSFAQVAAVGTFGIGGTGISASTKVASETMTFQRTALYKFGMKPDQQGIEIYLNNFGFTLK